MGMFDNIIVPKSYLRSLLKKEDEKLLRKDHLFQTKDLDNDLEIYKVHRQHLYKKNKPAHPFEEWKKTKQNVIVRFYDYLRTRDSDEYFIEFQFTFKDGKLDKKELLTFNLESTKKESKETVEMWETEQKILNQYRNSSLKYKFFSLIENYFLRITNWARKKHGIPLEIRKEAYEKSGRLKRDPKALDLYTDQ